MKAIAVFLFALCLNLVVNAQQDPISTNLQFQMQDSKPKQQEGGLAFFKNEDILKSQALSGNDRLDSLHYWEWVPAEEVWLLRNRAFFTQDENGNITRKLELGWNGTLWENKYLDSLVYNANNDVMYDFQMIWNGGNWNNSVQSINTYNSNDDLTEVLIQSWEGTFWENLYTLRYGYDTNHNVLIDTVGVWLSGEWEYTGQNLYSYDFNNNVDTFTSQNYAFGPLQDYSRTIYAYDASNNLTLVQTQKADISGIWNEWVRHLYTNQSHFTNHVDQEFVNGEWINKKHYFKSTNENNNLLSQSSEIWQSKWVNIDSSQYYYTSTTGTKNLATDEFGVVVYPNPAFTFINIDFENVSDGLITLEIFSIEGLKVLESRFNPLREKSLDITQLSSGMYYVLIRHEHETTIRIFVKM